MKKTILLKHLCMLSVAVGLLLFTGCSKKESPDNTNPPPDPEQNLTIYKSNGPFTLSPLAKYSYTNNTLTCVGNFGETGYADQMLGFIDHDNQTGNDLVYLCTRDGRSIYIYEVSNGQKGSALISISSNESDTVVYVYDFDWSASMGMLELVIRLNDGTKKGPQDRNSVTASNSTIMMNKPMQGLNEPSEEERWEKEVQQRFSPTNLNLIANHAEKVAQKLYEVGSDIANTSVGLWNKAKGSLSKLVENQSTPGTGLATVEESQAVSNEILPLTKDATNEPIIQRSLPPIMLKILSGGVQQGTTNNPLPMPAKVLVCHPDLRPIENVTVAFEANHGGTPAYDEFDSDVNGQISVAWKAGGYVGDQALIARIKYKNYFDCQPAEVYFTATITEGPPVTDEFVDFTITGPFGTAIKVTSPPKIIQVSQNYPTNHINLDFGTIVQIRYHAVDPIPITNWALMPCGTFSIVSSSSYNAAFSLEIEYTTDSTYYFATHDNQYYNRVNGTLTVILEGDYLTGSFDTEVVCPLTYYWGLPIVNRATGTFKVKRNAPW